MTDKQIKDNVSNFCLVCYYDNKTNELERIEQYYDNDTSRYSDIDSHRYGYNDEIIKPEKLIKQLKRKEQECEELKFVRDSWLSKCEQETKLREFYQDRLDQLKAENEGLKRKIIKIFACLIKANRANKILDTLWIDNITTLWDYIALALGIEGDQTQIEEQILQKISECEVENENKL